MEHRFNRAAMSVTWAIVVSLSLSHNSSGDSASSEAFHARQRRQGAVKQAMIERGLAGEWRVNCEVRTYKRGVFERSFQDRSASLVVAESDPDASFYIYKFPAGFGEGVPRLRQVSKGRYEGDDTINGIEYTVRQHVEVDGDKITINQKVLGSPGQQIQTETICVGTRLQKELILKPASLTADNCSSEHASGEIPARNIARRFKVVRPFFDGLAAAAAIPPGSRSLKWGFIDKTGRLVIPARYDVVSSFHDGLASVGVFYGRGRNIKWGIVEKLGPQVTPHVNFDAIKILGEGYAAVGYTQPGSSGLKWNLTNREYNVILHGFDEIGCFIRGRARASRTVDGVVHAGYVNKAGDFVTQK